MVLPKTANMSTLQNECICENFVQPRLIHDFGKILIESVFY